MKLELFLDSGEVRKLERAIPNGALRSRVSQSYVLLVNSYHIPICLSIPFFCNRTFQKSPYFKIKFNSKNYFIDGMRLS